MNLNGRSCVTGRSRPRTDRDRRTRRVVPDEDIEHRRDLWLVLAGLLPTRIALAGSEFGGCDAHGNTGSVTQASGSGECTFILDGTPR